MGASLASLASSSAQRPIRMRRVWRCFKSTNRDSTNLSRVIFTQLNLHFLLLLLLFITVISYFFLLFFFFFFLVSGSDKTSNNNCVSFVETLYFFMQISLFFDFSSFVDFCATLLLLLLLL